MESHHRLSKHTRTHTYTHSRKLTWAAHKSLSLTVWVAASCKPSAQLLNAATSHLLPQLQMHVSTRHYTYLHLHPWKEFNSHKWEYGYKLRHFYRHPLSSPISSFYSPLGSSFSLKSHSEAYHYNGNTIHHDDLRIKQGGNDHPAAKGSVFILK